ncbi:hypothetical protein [Fluviicola sp.]|uniref:hypothetical protein n=1 Tax=Fluviicola sp. TaxID=1917219 RepID=UPI0031DD1922
MKKSILLGLSPALLLLIAVGCQKENITPSASSNHSFTTKAQVNNLRVWHDNGKQPGVDGVDYGCWSTGGNCLPDVIVTPKLSQSLTAFAFSSSQAGYASANYSTLSSVISTSVLDGVIGGELVVSIRGSITATAPGYLTFTAHNQDIKAVYPFKTN